MPQETFTPNVLLFVGLWAVLGVAATAFFTLNKNAKLKRTIWPPYIIGLSAVFLGIIYMLGIRPPLLYIAIAFNVLIVILNLRNTQFCTSCGATVHGKNTYSRPESCPSCNAPLGGAT